MPKKAVTTDAVSSLVGQPDPQISAPVIDGVLPPAPVAMPAAVAIEPMPVNPLVVDDRMIPDAGLPTDYVEGVLDIANEGSGLLRPQRFAPSDHDVYISSSQIRRFNLRVGDMIGGQARRPKENERYWGLLKVEKVNGMDVEKVGARPNFDDMTAIYPDVQVILSTDKGCYSPNQAKKYNVADI